MDRRFEGTFQSETDAREEIKRLINEEGYAAAELLVVTDEKNSSLFKNDRLGSVEVDLVDSDDQASFWERIKETLSFGTYDSDQAHNALETHGVPHDIAEHHIEALKEGEIVLLADTDAPKKTEMSEVNKDVTNYRGRDNKMTDNNNKPIDTVNTEEEKAVKNNQKDVKPSDVDTSETDVNNMTNSIDPSQAQETREEEQVDTENKSRNQTNSSESDDYTTTSDDGQSLETTPDLTGEEETVEKTETDREYPSNIAKGVVKPDSKNSLNAEPKKEKDPSENSEAPGTDANEGGMSDDPSKDL